jgi:hypothetical protein
MRQQRNAMAIQRSAANRLGIVGAKSPTHGDRHGTFRRCEPPDIVPSPSVIDDAVVLLQIGGLLRRSAALQIVRCRDKERGCRAYPPGNQRGIGDLANTNLQIDSIFDKVAKPVMQDEIKSSSCFFSKTSSLLLK